MRNRSFGLLVVAIAFSSAVGLGISSCDSNSSNPATPGNGGVDHGKSPQVLDGPCLSSVGITNCPNGGATLRYNSEGYQEFNGLNGAAANSIDCNFGSPANVWIASNDVTFPQVAGSLSYASKDAAGNTEARVDLQQVGNGYQVFPTFTSAPGAGEAQYDAVIYNNGTEVGRQDAIAATSVVNISSDADCVLKVTAVRWAVYQVNAQCEYKLWLNPCCTYRFQLPDGTILSGNEIKLVERNTNGVYVYTQTHHITTSGNVATFNLKAATAYTN